MGDITVIAAQNEMEIKFYRNSFAYELRTLNLSWCFSFAKVRPIYIIKFGCMFMFHVWLREMKQFRIGNSLDWSHSVKYM